VRVILDVLRIPHQAKARVLPTTVAGRERLSKNASDFVLVMMHDVMDHFVDS
jgi:hypothetical protein